MSTSETPGQAMTARKKRGLEIDAREAELRDRRSAFERERSRIFRETGQKPGGKKSWSEEERAVHAELRALAEERAALVSQIDAELAKLRPQQAEFDRLRTSARAAGRRKKLPLTTREQKLRNKLALLQSERAYVDGTVRHDRDMARHEEAVWNTVLDATSWDSSYW
jgi:cell division protein FtsB